MMNLDGKSKELSCNFSSFQRIIFFRDWLSARIQVEKAFNTRYEVHESGEILRFENPCAWKDSVYEIEKKNNCVGSIKFVLFSDKSGGEGWRVQAVSVDQGSFSNRKSLKKEWRGISQEAFAQVSGMPDVVFCHGAGFIGGAKSYESALKMAVLSLQEQD